MGAEMRALGLGFDRDPRLAGGAGGRDARRSSRTAMAARRAGLRRAHLSRLGRDPARRRPRDRRRRRAAAARRPQSGHGGARFAADRRDGDMAARARWRPNIRPAALAEIALRRRPLARRAPGGPGGSSASSARATSIRSLGRRTRIPTRAPTHCGCRAGSVSARQNAPSSACPAAAENRHASRAASYRAGGRADCGPGSGGRASGR